MGDERMPIDKFDGTNFGFWKMQVVDYLYSNDLYQPLRTKPEYMQEHEWELLERKAMSVVRSLLSRNVALHTMEVKTTKELLEMLSEMYEKPSTAANKVHLIRRLFNSKMSETTSIAEHLNEFNLITDQLSSVKINFDDEIRAIVLLWSPPESWSETVSIASALTMMGKMKFEEVRDMIISEEIRRRDSSLNAERKGRLDLKSKSNRGRP